MGLPSLLGMMRALNVVGSPSNITPTDADAMSLVWFLIKTTARKNKEDNVWREITREARLLSYERALRSGGPIKESKPMNLLVDVVNAKLLGYGCVPGVTVLHFDGAASDQKFATRQARMGDRQTLTTQVEGLLDRVEAILEPLLQKDIDRLYTRSTRQKITRLSSKIKAQWSFVEVLSDDVMRVFRNDLRELGWTVHDCLGESDVCIARKMVHLGNVIPATYDSDFFCHGYAIVLRQDRKNKSLFREFHMGPILNSLEASLVVWKTAAAVSTNDYSKSVQGLSFRKNLDILKSIPEAEYMTDVDDEASPAAMDRLLGLYCRHPDVLSKVDGGFLNRSYYKHASDVFFHQHEDFTHAQVPFTNDTGNRIALHLADVAKYLQVYRDCHNAVATGIRAEMQGPFPFGLPPGLGGSPFKRPPVDLSLVRRVQQSSFISAARHSTIPQGQPAQQQQPAQQPAAPAAAPAAAPTGPGTATGGSHFLTDGATWTTSIPTSALVFLDLPPGLGGSPFAESRLRVPILSPSAVAQGQPAQQAAQQPAAPTGPGTATGGSHFLSDGATWTTSKSTSAPFLMNLPPGLGGSPFAESRPRVSVLSPAAVAQGQPAQQPIVAAVTHPHFLTDGQTWNNSITHFWKAAPSATPQPTQQPAAPTGPGTATGGNHFLSDGATWTMSMSTSALVSLDLPPGLGGSPFAESRLRVPVLSPAAVAQAQQQPAQQVATPTGPGTAAGGSHFLTDGATRTTSIPTSALVSLDLPPGLGGSPFAESRLRVPVLSPAAVAQAQQQPAQQAAAPTGPGTAAGGSHFLTDGATWTTSIPISAPFSMGLPPGLGGSPFADTLSSSDPSPGQVPPQRPRQKRSKRKNRRKKKEGPHTPFMPSNIFQASTFVVPQRPPPGNNTPQPTTENAGQRRRTNKRAQMFNPVPRKFEGKSDKPDKRDPSSIIKTTLQSRFLQTTLSIGTVPGCLEEGLRTNNIGSPSDHATIVKDVYACLNEAVRVITDCKRLTQLAIFCYTAKVIAEYPDPLNVNDRQACNARLRFIGASSDSGFIYKLVSDIFNWHKQRPYNPRGNEGEGVRYAIEAIQHFQSIVCRSSDQMLALDENIDQISQVFFGVRDAISDTLRIYFTTNIKELVERLRESNRVWCESPTGGKPILDTIDIDAGTSPLYRPAYLFWILNSRLPASKQFKFFPESKFGDQYITLTEQNILDIISHGPSSPATKETFRTTFAPTTSHQGEMVHRLFFSNKIDYHKSVCLINPSTIVRNSFKPRGFFDFSLTDRIEYERLLQDSIRATGDEVASSKNALQAFVKAHLRTPEEYRRLGEIDRARYYGRRRVLTGTIQTNGHDLKALVIDVTQRKPIQDLSYRPRTTRMLLDDVEVALETRLMLLARSLSAEEYCIIGIDPGIASTATAVIMDSRNPGVVKNMTISQGSLKESTRRFERVTARMKRKAKAVHQLKRNDLPGTVMTIAQLEAHIIPCKTPPMPLSGTRQQQQEWWRTLQISVENHVVSVIDVQEPLRKFYGSASYKIKTRNLEVAEYAIKHKGIDRIMQETGCTDRWQPGQVRPLFIVGDGDFGSTRGPSLHMTFLRLLKKKIEARNMIIMRADEYRTSVTCCQCMELATLSRRAVSCDRCGQERDRDHNAAHNIAQATLQWMRTQTWPSILSRESQQDNEEDQDL